MNKSNKKRRQRRCRQRCRWRKGTKRWINNDDWLARRIHTYSLTPKIINDISTCESYVRINREKPAVINFASVMRLTLDHIQFWFLSNAKIRYNVTLLLRQYSSTFLSEMPSNSMRAKLAWRRPAGVCR